MVHASIKDLQKTEMHFFKVHIAVYALRDLWYASTETNVYFAFTVLLNTVALSRMEISILMNN